MTQKKDFALDLKNCSKADREEVYALGESVGFVENSRPIRKKLCSYLMFINGRMFYYGKGEPIQGDRIIYSMPRDWDKIQEALGVSAEPKDGEVWVMNHSGWDIIVRFKGSNSDNCYYHSYIELIDSDIEFKKGSKLYLGRIDELKKYKWRKATPEEEKQLIEAEHSNGYHWDGESLVEIPEYVKCNHDGDILKVAHLSSDGKGYIPENSNVMFIGIKTCKPSTREAFEAQEAKKDLNERIDLLSRAASKGGSTLSDMCSSIVSAMSKGKRLYGTHLTTGLIDSDRIVFQALQCPCYIPQIDLIPFHGRNQYQKDIKKLTERITDLEGENLGYKELLKKRNKEIERLENSNLGLKHQNKRLRDFVNTVKGFELK